MFFLSYFLFLMIKDETPRRRLMLTIAFLFEIIVSAGLLVFVWLMSWTDFLLTSTAGKVISMVFSVIFVAYWAFAYKYAHDYYVDNLPDDKRNAIRAANPPRVNTQNSNGGRNYALLGNRGGNQPASAQREEQKVNINTSFKQPDPSSLIQPSE